MREFEGRGNKMRLMRKIALAMLLVLTIIASVQSVSAADEVFGKTDIGASGVEFNKMYGSYYTYTGSTGQVAKSISVYCYQNALGSEMHLKVGLYYQNKTLIAVTDETHGTKTATWVMCNFSTPPTLTHDQVYLIVITSDSSGSYPLGGNGLFVEPIGTAGIYHNPYTYASFPDPLADWDNYYYNMSAYVTYGELTTYYGLTVNSPSNGAINTTSGDYEDGTVVNLLATPDPNYAFVTWNIDGSNSTSDNPTSVTMTANHTIGAYFELAMWDLTITNGTHGSFNTTSGSYANDTTVIIEAYPDPHYYLDCFVLDGVNQTYMENNLEVLMDGDHTVTAYFDIILRGLTVYDPIGGSINATNGTYADGTTIYVEATPSANYTFSHWFTDYYLNSTDNPYELLIESNIDLYAFFDPYPVLESSLTITPNNATLYTNETLEFSAQLLFANGTPIADKDIIILLNGTVIYLDQSDALGWVNGTYNITALTEGNYTLTAKFNEIVDDTDHYILSGNETAPQQITISGPPAPAIPAHPSAASHSSSSSGSGLAILVMALIVVVVWTKNGQKPIGVGH